MASAKMMLPILLMHLITHNDETIELQFSFRMIEYPDMSMEEIPSEFIINTCQMLPMSCDVVYDIDYLSRSNCSIFCGSAMEFYIRPLNTCIADVDELHFKNDELAFSGDFPELPSDVSGLRDSIECYKIEPYLNYPGFVQLRYFGKVNYNWKYKKSQFNSRSFSDSYVYLVADMAAAVAEVGQEQGIENTTSGPAIKLYLYAGFEALDTVTSLWCPQWPKEAQGWPKRPRRNGWPTIETISEVLGNGCHVVYAQHRSCRDDKYQWRLSFSTAEVILLQSWTKIQQIVYHLLRFFAKRDLIQNDCLKEDEVLCTYYLKTLMLWTCEEKPPEWWDSRSVIVICCEMLKKLSELLKKGYCPNYFIPEANLFHEQSRPSILDKIKRKLKEFSDSKILSHYFVKDYIHSFINRQFINKNLHFADYLRSILILWSDREPLSLDIFFSYVFLYCNAHSRLTIKSEGQCTTFDVGSLCLIVKFHLLTQERIITVPENVWCFTYLSSAAFCLNAAYGLGSGKISWESEVYFMFVKELYVKPYKYIVRCQYHRYPDSTTAGSQFPFLRAQTILEQLSGLDSCSEFQLVSLLSKGFLKKALETSFISDDSQSLIAVPATLVYLAALHFAAAEYQTTVDLCLKVLQELPVFFHSETLNAGCLFFIDDVLRIVGFCLLSRKFSGHVHSNKSQIYLDLRLTPELFAYYLTLTSTERMSKQLKLNFNLSTASFPLDQLFAVSIKRKFNFLMKYRPSTSLTVCVS